MADITISSGTIRMANLPGELRVPGWIYIYPEGEPWWIYAYRSPLVPQSPNGIGGIPYMRVALVPTGSNPASYAYASFVIQSTEDAVINPSGARWAFYIFSDDDSPRYICPVAHMESVRIPATPTTNNLTDIAGFNQTSLPPVTNGDRLILGDLYAVNGVFSGDVTAANFFGNGAGLTGIGTGTGAVINTGSTTVGADSDSNGDGIVSLQTRTIERARVDNDGKFVVLGAMDVTGLATFSLGASIPGAKQLSWTTANVAAPSLTDNTIGSRIKIHDGAAPDHTAIGLESGAGWFNTADANAWKFYYAAVLKHTLTKDIFSLNGALHFLSGATNRARIEASASDRLLFEKGDGTELLRIDGGGNGTLTAPNALFAIGSTASPIGTFRGTGASGFLMYDGAANVMASIKSPAASVLAIHGFTGGAAVQMPVKSATPTDPASSAEFNMYNKGSKFIIQYNDAGTVRYKYLDLTGTGVTWVHSLTAP